MGTCVPDAAPKNNGTLICAYGGFFAELLIILRPLVNLQMKGGGERMTVSGAVRQVLMTTDPHPEQTAAGRLPVVEPL